MRFGIDITPLSAGKGGVQNYTRALVQGLLGLDRRNEYRLFHNGPASPFRLATASSHPGVEILTWRGKLAHLTATARQLPKSPAAAAILAKALPMRSSRILKDQLLAGLDLFHSSDVFLWDNAPAANLITVFDLTTILFPEFHTELNVRIHARKIAFVKKPGVDVVAISQCTKNDLVKHCGISPERIRVIYPGCDPRLFRPLPEEDVLPVLSAHGLERGYILAVGTIEPRKNLVGLISAFEILARLGSRSERLVLVGAKGWLSRETFARIASSPLRGRIKWLDHVPESDLPQLYNGAALLAYPSFYEGFGLPIVEAMACGVPVVAADRSSAPELVQDTGLLVDPCDPEEMARAMQSLLADRARRREIAEKGMARARFFSWERMVREILEAYREAVESKKRQLAATRLPS